MKRAMAAVLIAGFSASAGAQIIRPTLIRQPDMYISFSVGWLTQQPICDPVNDACWNFRDAAQYRVSFEKPLGPATSIGFSYSHAAVPLLWADNSGCSLCDANSEVHQLLGLIHMGGAGPFTQLIDISAGATRFANFKAADGTPLGTGKPITDFSIGVGYGFGIRLGREVYFTLQQEYGAIFHKRMPTANSGVAEQRTLRGGLRMSL